VSGLGESGTQVQRSEGSVRIASHRLRLVVTRGPSAGATHEIRAPRLVVGSGEGAEVRLDDPTVSRRHFALEARDGRYFVQDLDSTNGTWLEGVRVERAEVHPPATIRAGDTELSFEPKIRFERVSAAPDALPALRGSSPAMREAKALLAQIAPTELSVVLVGETGTGKDVAARALHAASARAEGPFVVIPSS
jgi:predicted component of type VI protein secretion system